MKIIIYVFIEIIACDLKFKMWPEILQVKQDNKRELNLNHTQFTKLLKNNNDELDNSIFELNQLNYLQLTNSEVFHKIPNEIGLLTNLQTLLLFGNQLTSVPGKF
jgi:Leucine-rich repeat (LRR) protein